MFVKLQNTNDFIYEYFNAVLVVYLYRGSVNVFYVTLWFGIGCSPIVFINTVQQIKTIYILYEFVLRRCIYIQY